MYKMFSMKGIFAKGLSFLAAILFCGLIFFMTHLSLTAENEAQPKPLSSVLLITLDTTRADHIGCYGASFAETPNIDSLAKEGVRFDNAYSPVPLTLPSHASILTGLVPRRHGVRDNALFRLDTPIPVLTEILKRCGYATAAFISSVILDRSVGLDSGFDVYDDSVRIGERSAFNYEERAASQVTDAALSSLDKLEPPFFLWVHYFDPHLSYIPPEPFRTRFKDRLYDGEIAFMDQQIGRLLEQVKKKTGSLFIIAAGDHGESLGEHGETAHDVFLYDATQRVPLIISGPSIVSGRMIERNVGLIDIAPTILDLLSLPQIQNIDGHSLAPLLTEKFLKKQSGEEDHGPLYEMESFFPHFSYGWAPLRALVHKNYKYIQAPRPELYNLAVDPSETKNLIDAKKKIADDLAERLGKLTAGDVMEPLDQDPELLEQRRKIESLGYVGGSRASIEQSTIDPKDGIQWIVNLESARRELQRGDPKKGIPLMEDLLKKNPENLPALLVLSQCFSSSGNLDQGIAFARKAVSMNPENDIVHYNLASTLAEKAATDQTVSDEALSEFERVLQINPRHANAYLAYFNFLIMNKKVLEAYNLLERARMNGVEDPDIETKMGLLKMSRSAVHYAKAAFERAIVLNPRATKALEGLGKIAFTENDFPLSAYYYARAFESTPSSDLAKTLGSIFLYSLNDEQSARRAFQMALELMSPDDPDRQNIIDIISSLESNQQLDPKK